MSQEVPNNISYTKSHEYTLPEDGTIKVGISDYAIEQLGDVVFVELPEVGSTFSKGEVFGTIESVKAASELYMPVSGKVAEVNERLISEPELVNNDCYGNGWLIKVSDYNKDELANTMKYDEYKEFLDKEEE